jgi:hypothetical protein
LELGPSRAATSEMLAQYVKATGDADVGRRLPVAELVYGALLLRRGRRPAGPSSRGGSDLEPRLSTGGCFPGQGPGGRSG